MREEVSAMPADERNQGEMARMKLLFTNYFPCIFVGCGLQFFQQFVGINTVMYYGPSILK